MSGRHAGRWCPREQYEDAVRRQDELAEQVEIKQAKYDRLVDELARVEQLAADEPIGVTS